MVAAGSALDPDPRRSGYWLTRFAILRLLGVVYAVAFLVAAQQLKPLIGSRGLLPVGPFFDRATAYFGSTSTGFFRLPTLFWWNHSDAALLWVSWTGFVLAGLLAAGFANAITLSLLWFLYLSIVHAGQDWYGYGWETQLLETGFLAIFLCPLLDPRPFPARAPPPLVIGLFRWLIFRIMLGSALIKLRGDSAWHDLSALYYHFETQPIPNPLSRWFHFLPKPVLRGGVLFNYLAELVAPWFVFGPRWPRRIAGGLIIALQGTLILSGNLSFLNWLTIIPALACWDDGVWSRWLGTRLTRRAARAAAAARPHGPTMMMSAIVTALVAVLSYEPLANLVSPHQIMNTSFEAWDLVNSYGAFGSVGRERYNVVFEGTDDLFGGDQATWLEYRYRGLPVDPHQRPPQIAPYQLRLDWQMWFAAMGKPEQYPWTLHLIWQLLHNEPGAISLFAANPFPDHPPRYVRAVLYRYQFAPPHNPAGLWWQRTRLGLWLEPLTADDPNYRLYLAQMGWISDRNAP